MYIQIPLQSKVLGGVHIVTIHDEHGNLIFREKKGKRQSAVSFRPWFIGKKYALKIYYQFALNTSCFWRNTRSNITPVV